ncbi:MULTISPECIES: trigger factor [Carnobacterium]|uniref:Trigger factor n=1 Tax=Carnobacterium divergens TaxID=2748 RepID=A0A4R9CHU2_CARDV|nr:MULTISPECIES: trigger factor [Carnobacterium]ANZ99729.1 trigger factor [Carnobacterium divergens]MDT1938640.1 trigger factor [Carnobacterium divergens]MDT1941078.1 trigger factor [Carnobacterium divergens]MDT1946876.1 trigger factor [Carnobacterium divergens]MDT1949313.1 trigger factor [Carnobacterium divergens]
MTAKWEKKGANDGVLTFEITEEKIKEGIEKAFNKVKKNLDVPGFRKGKVSRQVFNKMYGEEALYEDALNVVLPEAYAAALEESGIDPVDQPKIDVLSMEKGQAWVITADVTVKPEVKLGEYKNLTVEKQDREVTDADVEENIKQKQAAQAELVLKEEAAVNGDTVVIDFEGFKDGVAFDGGKGENTSLELGSNSFIPGFEEQLIGAKAGDEVEVKVTFPEEYHSEDLKGAEAVFNVKVHEVKAKELPELDDEFAKDIDEEVETLAELKEKIKKELTDAKLNAAEEAVQEAAIRQAVDNAEIVELPHVMVHDEVHRQMDQFLNDMQRQGVSPEMYYQLTGTTEEDLHKQMEADADIRTRTNLVLEAIVAAEGFEPTEEEVEKEIKELAEQYNMEEKAVRAALSVDMLKHDISMKKAIDTITETAVEK